VRPSAWLAGALRITGHSEADFGCCFITPDAATGGNHATISWRYAPKFVMPHAKMSLTVKQAEQCDDHLVLCVCCNNAFRVLAISLASSFSPGNASLYWLDRTLLCRFPSA
jgi:hypothetical protein